MPQQAEPKTTVRGPGDLVQRALRLREVRADSREADFTFSTNAEDRYGEVVEQVWQLDNFNRNPVALYAHESRELPIGYAKDVGVIDGSLRGTIVFATDKANPKAEQVWQGIQEKTLRAVSVGFYPHSTRWETENDRERLILTDNELVEISVVPIPANPEALLRMRQRFVDMANSNTHPPPEERGGETQTRTNKESEVDELKEAKAALDAKTVEAEQISRDLQSERAKVVALESRCATLEAERNERQAHINDLTSQIVKRDLEALVGVKIAPTEVEGLVKLASLDRALYSQQLEAIKARPDMGLVREEPVVGHDPAPPKTDSAECGASADLFAEAQSRAKEA